MDREEAINIVKKNWPNGRHQLSEALEFLVPELAESEDEKIRKGLISIVKSWIEYNPKSPFEDKSICADNKEWCDKIIDWLERQKSNDSAIKDSDPILDSLLADSTLPRWVWIKLKRNGVDTVRDLARLHKWDILKMKCTGRKSLSLLDEFLDDNGLDWGMNV